MPCRSASPCANTHSVTLSEMHSDNDSEGANRTRNYIRLDKIRLDNKGGAGGNVETSATQSPCPSVPSPTEGIGETKDPLRHVQAWADSMRDGTLDASDLFILQQLIDEARGEIRTCFVPLSLAVRMARPKSEIWSDSTPDEDGRP